MLFARGAFFEAIQDSVCSASGDDTHHYTWVWPRTQAAACKRKQ
jgi:hypothetical protein